MLECYFVIPYSKMLKYGMQEPCYLNKEQLLHRKTEPLNLKFKFQVQ